jgi:hypothetical protein
MEHTIQVFDCHGQLKFNVSFHKILRSDPDYTLPTRLKGISFVGSEREKEKKKRHQGQWDSQQHHGSSNPMTMSLKSDHPPYQDIPSIRSPIRPKVGLA